MRYYIVICEKNDNCSLSQFENKSFYVHYQMLNVQQNANICNYCRFVPKILSPALNV